MGCSSLGVTEGETIAVVLSNRREFIECYGAAIQSGLFFVAINWHLGPSEISYILEDSSARVVVTESRFADIVAGAGKQAGLDPSMIFTVDASEGYPSFAELTKGQSEDAPLARAPGQIMFYTSGTTGRPKGVRKSFRGNVADELTLTSGIGPIRRAAPADNTGAQPSLSDMVFISSGPFYHALPAAGVMMALDSAGTVVVMDKWTPESFLDLVQEFRVTNATLVPTMFHRLLALPDEVRKNADISSLRAVNHAGAPCSIDVKRRMIEWWGPIITEQYSSTRGRGRASPPTSGSANRGRSDVRPPESRSGSSTRRRGVPAR